MFRKGRKLGTMRFVIRPDGSVGRVFLAGDFTNWLPVRMRKAKAGAFAVTVPLSEGTHEYKFIVDGRWMIDPDNASSAANPYGTANSLVQME